MIRRLRQWREGRGPGGFVAERSRLPQQKTSVLLADDHEVFRQGLRALLDEEDDIVVVGEAPDGRQAVDLAMRLGPDVVVMDVAMPHLNGIEATRHIVATLPATRVLILSAHFDADYFARATESGAVGYVLKQASLAELAGAVRKAAQGRTWVSPAAARLLRNARVAATVRAGTPATGAAQLTWREAEVLQLIAESLCNKEIARELGISVKTVEKHRQSLMTKLDLHDIAGLTRHAIESRVVECDCAIRDF